MCIVCVLLRQQLNPTPYRQKSSWTVNRSNVSLTLGSPFCKSYCRLLHARGYPNQVSWCILNFHLYYRRPAPKTILGVVVPIEFLPFNWRPALARSQPSLKVSFAHNLEINAYAGELSGSVSLRYPGCAIYTRTTYLENSFVTLALSAKVFNRLVVCAK